MKFFNLLPTFRESENPIFGFTVSLFFAVFCLSSCNNDDFRNAESTSDFSAYYAKQSGHHYVADADSVFVFQDHVEQFNDSLAQADITEKTFLSTR